MRTAEIKNQPVLSVTGGGKTYQVDVPQLTDFLDRVKERCKIESVYDLTTHLDVIADTVLDGVPDDYQAIEVKHPMKLLRELTYLFNGLLREVH